MQAEAMVELENSDMLTTEEVDIVRWAMNAKWRKPKRFLDDRAPLLTYKKASALEALVRLPPRVRIYERTMTHLLRLIDIVNDTLSGGTVVCPVYLWGDGARRGACQPLIVCMPWAGVSARCTPHACLFAVRDRCADLRVACTCNALAVCAHSLACSVRIAWSRAHTTGTFSAVQLVLKE